MSASKYLFVNMTTWQISLQSAFTKTNLQQSYKIIGIFSLVCKLACLCNYNHNKSLVAVCYMALSNFSSVNFIFHKIYHPPISPDC